MTVGTVQSETDLFTGKVAIVTGASGGIGRATAELLAARGARVVVVDIDGSAAKLVADSIGGIAVEADVSTEAGADTYMQAAMQANGRVDVLVNCAGIQRLAAIVSSSLADYDLHMAVNARSVFLGLRAVLPAMYRQRSGAVVSTSSVNGLMANRNASAYVASKHAVIGLTKAAALEAGEHGVRVNAVCPGPIDTPMLRRFATAEVLAHISEAEMPLQRVGQPGEVAELIAFLASDRASFLSGEAVRVDGGLLAGSML